MFRNNNTAPKFLTIYYFQGRFISTYAGHTAISDGTDFYSYGGAIQNMTGGAWVADEKVLSSVLPAEKEKYGKLQRIILPVNLSQQKWEAIRERLPEWGESDYHLFKHNCVDFVKFYLEMVGYPAKIYGLPSVLPSSFADDMRELGKDIIAQVITQGRRETSEEDALLNKTLKNLLVRLPQKEQKIIVAEQTITLQYYKLLEILAKKHYSGTNEPPMISQLYSDALAVCPVLAKFIYEPSNTFQTHPIKSSYQWIKDGMKVIGVSIVGGIFGAVSAVGAFTAMGMGVALGVLSIPVLIVVLPYHLLKKESELSKADPPLDPKELISIHEMLSIEPELIPEPKKEVSISVVSEKSQTTVQPELIAFVKPSRNRLL